MDKDTVRKQITFVSGSLKIWLKMAFTYSIVIFVSIRLAYDSPLLFLIFGWIIIWVVLSTAWTLLGRVTFSPDSFKIHSNFPPVLDHYVQKKVEIPYCEIISLRKVVFSEYRDSLGKPITLRLKMDYSQINSVYGPPPFSGLLITRSTGDETTLFTGRYTKKQIQKIIKLLETATGNKVI